MIIFEILGAICVLGIPVGAMSWFLVRRMYQSGRISRDADFNTVKSNVRDVKKESKGQTDGDFIQTKWMKFGGGFYGITALTTLILIEIGEGASFVANFPGNVSLENGLIAFIISVLLNQFQNFISAFLWFGYWADEGRSIFVWVGVPYIAYLLGMYAAGKSWDELVDAWEQWLQSLRRDQDN